MSQLNHDISSRLPSDGPPDSVDEEKGLVSSMEFTHEYAPTKLMWVPDKEGTRPDLIATTAEFLRIWKLEEGEGKLESLLTNKQSDFSAPLTSFDWNEVDQKRIGTSSIDTTCRSPHH